MHHYNQVHYQLSLLCYSNRSILCWILKWPVQCFQFWVRKKKTYKSSSVTASSMRVWNPCGVLSESILFPGILSWKLFHGFTKGMLANSKSITEGRQTEKMNFCLIKGCEGKIYSDKSEKITRYTYGVLVILLIWQYTKRWYVSLLHTR